MKGIFNGGKVVTLPKASSAEAENCKVLLTLQVLKGKPTIQVDLLTTDFEAYDTIQQDMVRLDVDFLEHFYKPLNSTVTHFKIDARINLLLRHNEKE